MGVDLIGAVLDGRYKVVERVAEGAMGVVYRGERIKLGRAVAIKFLHTWNAEDAAARKRFEVEARAMARLEHPHCAAVIDVGEYEGAPYVVMDYVRGTNLREILDEGPLQPARAAEIMKQVLSGLAHAHDLEIVHRDIKPANIMLSDKTGLGEVVKILDFGLARLRGSTGGLTIGMAIGTPSYMAPEQIVGGAVDGRTDVYACGVLMFEMLTGDKPFVADEPLEVLRMHRELAPPRASDRAPAAARAEVRAFDDVVARALAKRPEDRFASAADFSKAIDGALRGRSGHESGAVEPPPSRAPAPGAVARRAGDGSPPRDARSGGHASSARDLGSAEEFVSAPHGGAAREGALARDQDVLHADGDPSARDAGSRGVAGGLGGAELEAARSAGVGGAGTASKQGQGAELARRFRGLDPSTRRWIVGGAIAFGGLAGIGIVAAIASGGARRSEAVDAAPVVVVPVDAAEPSDDVLARARDLVAQGDTDAALRILDSARRTFPDRAVISYEMGRIYFARLWWRDGMAAFRAAIRADPGYRTDPDLIKTVLRGFITTPDTDEGLAGFLRSDIGDAAIPYLQETAQSHPNAKIRARAASLLDRYH